MSTRMNYAVLIKDHVLTGPNYVDWRRNIKLLLSAEGLMFVLDEDEPEFPNEENPESKPAYELFRQKNSKAKLLVLSSLEKTIADSVKDLYLTKDMMEELKEMYGREERHAHHQLDIYGSFIVNYNMNKLSMEFPKLGNMLPEVEAASKK
ncbi:uncharacterized protein LOC122650421 [Telopea speciosissima]|uniref:uncharacterized protein LOC122650421 n=1 Tax=Telopea speciosissima TaxID=54955 RepID=UPI001CC3AA58|nr:uncharacterized protein LOC122650421 [Telopea speciosissima]